METKIYENGNEWICELIGRMDTDAAVGFEQTMTPLMEHADRKIVLDCNQMEYISSSGLRMFLTLRKQSLAKGGDIVLRGVNPAVKQVFALTGFSTLFRFE